MTFLWPWALLILTPVAAAAVWALRRPMHLVVPVGSLKLWVKTLESLGTAGPKYARRLTTAWMLLLVGAVLAGFALARPMLTTQQPRRRVALAVAPVADLGAAGRQAMIAAAEALLTRLSAADEVQVIVLTSQDQRRLPPVEALRFVRELPLWAGEARVGGLAAEPRPQHTYALLPGFLSPPEWTDLTTIGVPARPGPLTIDAFGASLSAAGMVEVFVAVRNDAPASEQGEVLVYTASAQTPAARSPVDLAPGGRASLGARVAPDAWIAAGIAGQTGPGSAAFVARREQDVRTVAMLGRDDPLVRRFLQIYPAARLTPDAAAADVLVVVGQNAPPPTGRMAGKPALVIAPPAPPPGWSAAGTLANLALRDAAADRQNPLLKDVDLSAVAVRQATAWQSEAPRGLAVLSQGPSALIVHAPQDRRVYLAFDTATDNTNFALTQGFVIFMANVMSELAGGRTQVSYEYVPPAQADLAWQPVATPLPRVDLPLAGGLWPGVYRDAAGRLQAVSLPGLRSAQPVEDPVQGAARAPLPQPALAGAQTELWPHLAAAAMLLWLAGWWLRLRQ